VKNTKAASTILAGALSLAILAGCGAADNNTAVSGGSATAQASVSAASSVSASTIAAASAISDISFDSDDYDFDWKSGSYTALDMSAGSQTVTKSGVYEVTGTLPDGSLIVDVDNSADSGTVFLVLNNTSITSATSAPIYVKDAEKVVLILEDGTTNTVSQGSAVEVNSDEEPSAAVFSKADLTVTGGGTLTVTSGYNDGITSKDSLKITDGVLVVNAAQDGIVGKDALAVENGSITVTAGKDGLKSSNETEAGLGNILLRDGAYTISAGGDAIQAVGVLQIDGGAFDLTTGGGYAGSINTGMDSGPVMQGGQPGQMGAAQTAQDVTTDAEDSDSKKALKADGGIVIGGGDFTISSYEDAVHTGGSVAIGGGALTISAGDDAVHADADVTVGGGAITVISSYEGIEGKNITVGGGTLRVTSDDDGFNVNDASGVLTISGGEITVNAGGDGLDSNGSITMTGGTVAVDGPTNNGNGAVDYNAGFEISGGTFAAAGSSGMAQTGSGGSQPSMLMTFTSTQSAGTAVSVRDGSGNTVAEITPAKQYGSVAISAPGLKTGQTYTLWSGESQVVSFTITDTVTYLNESGVTTGQGMMGGGQMGGGQFGGQPHSGGQFGAKG
jgi:hypothetical protein